MRQIFIHLHIPKCGGSTVVDLLSRNFGPDLGYTNSILNDYQYDADQVARIIDHFPHLKCLTGHKLSLNLPFYRKDLDIQAFTWIRDPVDRFVSHYFYHRNHTTFVPEAKTMDLLEYTEWALKYENQKMYINGQTRFLSGGSVETIRSMVKDGNLLLFPLSKLQESFYTLAHKFPKTFVDLRIKSKNVSKKDQVLLDNFRDLILPYVEEDMYLLELSRQTTLENKRPLQQERFLSNKFKTIRSDVALKASHYLHHVARFIEKKC